VSVKELALGQQRQERENRNSPCATEEGRGGAGNSVSELGYTRFKEKEKKAPCPSTHPLKQDEKREAGRCILLTFKTQKRAAVKIIEKRQT